MRRGGASCRQAIQSLGQGGLHVWRCARELLTSLRHVTAASSKLGGQDSRMAIPFAICS